MLHFFHRWEILKAVPYNDTSFSQFGVPYTMVYKRYNKCNSVKRDLQSGWWVLKEGKLFPADDRIFEEKQKVQEILKALK